MLKKRSEIIRDSKGRFVKGIVPWNKNIKMGSPYNKLFLDNKKIVDLYAKELFNVKEISKIFRCSVKPIYRILKEEHTNLSLSDRRKKLFEAKKINKPLGMKGMKQSEDTKEKIRRILKKKFDDGEIIPHNKGKTKEDYEPLRRASEINKEKWKDKTKHPMFGKKHSEDAKKKISEHSGMKRLEVREKLSKSLKGKHNSPKTEFKKGKNHIFFNNWASLEPYDHNFQKEFKRFIKERDGCCMLCNIGFDDLRLLRRMIHIHHINYDKKLSIPQNCITLCDICHPKTNFNRPHWITFFQSLLLERYGYKYLENGKIILEIKNE